MNGLALCAGIGGLELGLRLASPRYRTVGYVERESYAAAALVARMEEQALDQAPVWDDLATFDGKPWRGVVDIVSAGFPCPPFSTAGQRKGISDERWLWPDIARIVSEVGPSLVFIENVDGLLGHPAAVSQILSDLDACGFDAEWDLFSASSVGAGHERLRFFLLAHSRYGTGGPEQWLKSTRPEEHAGGVEVSDIARFVGSDVADGQERRSPGHASGSEPPLDDSEIMGRGDGHSDYERENGGAIDASRHAGKALAYASRIHEREQSDGSRSEPRQDTWSLAVGVGHRDESGSDSERRYEGSGSTAPSGRAVVSHPLPIFPPLPNDFDGWTRVLDIMPTVEPAFCRMADGLSEGMERPSDIPRQSRLHALGNGVVPIVAALAFRVLSERLA